jgi:hypothetical protein
MTFTGKNKSKNRNKNKTRKNKVLLADIKTLEKGSSIYGAKNKNMGYNILDYTRSNEIKKKTHCIYENISWFAGLEQAKHYKGKEDEIFRWNVNKTLNLIKITERNRSFLKTAFLNTRKKIKPVVNISKDSLKKIEYEHKFLNMTNNERALYEFNFIFGYLTLKEQYDFLLFIKYLIKNNIIDILSRHETSLLPQIDKKINFYKLYPFGKKENLNRVSLYEINKRSLLNLCAVLNRKHNIDGVYQPNTNSYWYPDLIVYHMNIEEYILFSPHTELKNDGIV